MTKIAIVPNAAGTGTFTIEAPNSNSNRTLVLPDAAGELLTDVSDIETQVKAATNATGSAPVYACRAWVNFGGSGQAVINASGNVSSTTRNGSGQYTVNFSTAMPDALYTALVLATEGSIIGVDDQRRFVSAPFGEYTASSFKFGTVTPADNAFVDSSTMNVAIFR
jgi:hypothetical protein